VGLCKRVCVCTVGGGGGWSGEGTALEIVYRKCALVVCTVVSYLLEARDLYLLTSDSGSRFEIRSSPSDASRRRWLDLMSVLFHLRSLDDKTAALSMALEIVAGLLFKASSNYLSLG
jgi:hypothetical protein